MGVYRRDHPERRSRCRRRHCRQTTAVRVPGVSDACPTHAIVEPYVVDFPLMHFLRNDRTARRRIAARGRENLEGWFTAAISVRTVCRGTASKAHRGNSVRAASGETDNGTGIPLFLSPRQYAERFPPELR